MINGYLTNRIGADSVFGSIRFNNSEISAGYSDLFEFHGFSENSPTGLTVAFYTVGSIIILAVLLIRDVQQSLIPCISTCMDRSQRGGLPRSYKTLQNRKPRSVRHRCSHQIFCSLLLFMLLMPGSVDAASTSADGPLSSANIA
eukprot:SAG11_NODE_5151_length_1646_cov_2.073045_1_plen_143_part_10